MWDSRRTEPLQLFAERRYEITGTGLSNPYALTAPSVSADGSRVAYSGEILCQALRCGTPWLIYGEHFFSNVATSSRVGVAARAGFVRLSRNGRFAAFASPIPGSTGETSIDRVDLSNGSEVRIRQPGPGRATVANTLRVASDGTVVFRSYYGLTFSNGAGLQSYGIDGPFDTDDRAETVVLIPSAFTSNAGSLIVFHRSTGSAQALVSASEGFESPSLTSDGSLVLFLSRANFSARNNAGHLQAFLIGTDGSNLRQVTRPEDDVAAAVLSGDGRVAYAATSANQLLRISVSTGRVEEMIPPTPALARHALFDLAPGSLLTLPGRALTKFREFAGTTPLPSQLANVRVLIEGRQAPIVSVAPEQIVVQVPWETSVHPHGQVWDPVFDGLPLVVQAESESPLEGLSATVGVLERSPSLLLIANQDFQSLVTRTSGARRGEVIHLYMTGLGSVSPSIPTGFAAPSDRFTVLDAPLFCGLVSSVAGVGLEVLFGGLAPGYVGLYQVDIRIPEDFPPAETANLFCSQGSGAHTTRFDAFFPIN